MCTSGAPASFPFSIRSHLCCTTFANFSWEDTYGQFRRNRLGDRHYCEYGPEARGVKAIRQLQNLVTHKDLDLEGHGRREIAEDAKRIYFEAHPSSCA